MMQVPTYGNWKRPSSAGVGRFGLLATVSGFAGLVVVIITLMAFGIEHALVMFGVVAVLEGVLVWKDAHSRTGLQKLAARVGWVATKAGRHHVYRSGPTGKVPTGTCQLPGVLARVELREFEDGYGRRFGLLSIPQTNTYCVVLGTEPDGMALVDSETVDSRVAAWGYWLAALADEPGLEAASVTIETCPDSGASLRREVERSISVEAPEFAKAMLSEIVDAYPAGSSQVRGYVALTFKAAMRAGGKARSMDEMGLELASRLPGLTAALEGTGAGRCRLLTAGQISEVVRLAFDPAAQSIVDEARAGGDQIMIPWADAGPVGAEASWDSYHHDSAWSITWSMSAPPRGLVQSSVLSRLLAPHPDIARKRVTWLYRPLPAAQAAAAVDREVRVLQSKYASDSTGNARVTRDLVNAQATAAEEAAGAALISFGCMVTATVLEKELLPDAVAAVDNLCASARIRLRVVTGSQDSAFVACLPLGLVLSKHSVIPQSIREAL